MSLKNKIRGTFTRTASKCSRKKKTPRSPPRSSYIFTPYPGHVHRPVGYDHGVGGLLAEKQALENKKASDDKASIITVIHKPVTDGETTPKESSSVASYLDGYNHYETHNILSKVSEKLEKLLIDGECEPISERLSRDTTHGVLKSAMRLAKKLRA